MDRDKRVWKYRIDPGSITTLDSSNGRIANVHKTGHQDGADGQPEEKILPIGPKAQALLTPWLRADPDEFLFQPREAVNKHLADRRKQKATTTSKSKGMKPRRAPADHYDRSSYGRAITRAAKRAGVPHWHPHQLKHSCGTNIRADHGIEKSQLYMGHKKISTAELYAERDWKTVEEVAYEMG